MLQFSVSVSGDIVESRLEHTTLKICEKMVKKVSLFYLLILTVFSNISVFSEARQAEKTKKVCYGTNNGLAFSGTTELSFNRTRARFTGCTHVIGNLELTHIDISFDLSFLSTIEVVTGYVLIAVVDTVTIPLTSLRFIRGDEKFTFHDNEYAMSILMVFSREGLQMPAIKEISGNVILKLWSMCHLNTIAWDVFTKGTFSSSEETPLSCEPCDPACLDTHDGVHRCWGPGEDMCQSVNRIECDWFCRNGTCFEEGILGCCHPECLGCFDQWNDAHCEECRHFRHEGRCVPECPPGTYENIDTCTPRRG